MASLGPLVAAGAPQPQEANGPAVFSLLVPYGSRLLPCKFQLRSPPSWPPNGQEFENFALNFHFLKALNPAIAPQRLIKRPNKRRQTTRGVEKPPHAKFEALREPHPSIGGVIDGAKNGRRGIF